MNEEIRREAMLHPGVEVEIRSADDDIEKQKADLRYFASHDFDVILAAPIEADALTPVVKEVHDAGKPIVIFDRDIKGKHYTAFQGADNAHLGREAARYARHLVPPGSGVIEIEGLPGSTPARGRHEGFAAQAGKDGLKLLASAPADWNDDKAAAVADSLLHLYPQTRLIYAHNDRMAMAASRRARDLGMQVKTIGIDGAPGVGIRAVSDSLLDATFIYPTEGDRLLLTALAIARGEKYEENIELPVTSAVDKTNADILLLQDKYLREETSNLREMKEQVDDYLQRHSAQTVLLYVASAFLLLLALSLFLLLRAFWQRRAFQDSLLEKNRQLAEERDKQQALITQVREATEAKLAFFTNVSHDLRTPLTLISEPVEQIASAPELTPRRRALMQLARKNVRVLGRLINQILDFGKMEHGRLELHNVEIDAVGLVRGCAASFESMARSRRMRFSVDCTSPEGTTMAADPEKLERIVFNLLSNAFKYTPDGGNVSVACSQDDTKLSIVVSDSGRGMSRHEVTRIFDRFYRADNLKARGSGIGLSLVKAFIELHGGSIAVESAPEKGTTFNVEIPVSHASCAEHRDPTPVMDAAAVSAELAPVEFSDSELDPEKPLLLVVDDNPDMRQMVGALMEEQYNVISAADGQQALHLASKYVPDVVVCDVMMPGVDGLEFCRRLKQEVSTSHIPVLLLTACSLDEQRAMGYDAGADAYLGKPFNSQVLASRLRSLIDNRRRIKEVYGTADPLLPVAPAEASAGKSLPSAGGIDSEFYARFLEILERQMSDPALGVEALASHMGLGRSQFYRKIKALTGFSPVELLRNVRLKKGREMLTGTDKTVSEIAYAVGFSSPAYFTRCYREAYGETPSDLRENLRGR